MNKNKIKLLKLYTVLLVDDDQGILDELSELLNLFFKTVYTSNNGKNGYYMYVKYSPDIIISDIKMHKLNGIDFLKKVRGINSDISLCLVSSYTDLNYLLDATELNLLKYIVKPITNTKLFDLFDKFLSKKKLLNAIVLSDGYLLNKDLSQIETNNNVIKLTNKELGFISLLLSKKSIVTYSEIEDILDMTNYESQHSIRQFIKKLRIKLPKNYISNIQQCGYSISDQFINKDTS